MTLFHKEFGLLERKFQSHACKWEAIRTTRREIPRTGASQSSTGFCLSWRARAESRASNQLSDRAQRLCSTPRVITHLSDWTLKKIEGLSSEQLPFSLSITPAWLLEKWTAPAQSYSRILRGNMAPCSNNEILKASVTYNHSAKRVSQAPISYKLEFKKPSDSLGRSLLFCCSKGSGLGSIFSAESCYVLKKINHNKMEGPHN